MYILLKLLVLYIYIFKKIKNRYILPMVGTGSDIRESWKIIIIYRLHHIVYSYHIVYKSSYRILFTTEQECCGIDVCGNEEKYLQHSVRYTHLWLLGNPRANVLADPFIYTSGNGPRVTDPASAYTRNAALGFYFRQGINKFLWNDWCLGCVLKPNFEWSWEKIRDFIF
jgi:hypothetical protein